MAIRGAANHSSRVMVSVRPNELSKNAASTLITTASNAGLEAKLWLRKGLRSCGGWTDND
ncbi:hypothetical protein FMN63_28720 [Stappia sp. BW2]|nr:hypothetical protein FMN63_28720 [Stappia sp. BW2]